MRKRITTRWYFAAWVVWVFAFVAMVAMFRGNSETGTVMAGGGVVMLVTWIGALVKLATQRTWSWFVALLVPHLFGLGIIAMAAYALVGPEDTEVVIRPAAT